MIEIGILAIAFFLWGCYLVYDVFRQTDNDEEDNDKTKNDNVI